MFGKVKFTKITRSVPKLIEGKVYQANDRGFVVDECNGKFNLEDASKFELEFELLPWTTK